MLQMLSIVAANMSKTLNQDRIQMKLNNYVEKCISTVGDLGRSRELAI